MTEQEQQVVRWLELMHEAGWSAVQAESHLKLASGTIATQSFLVMGVELEEMGLVLPGKRKHGAKKGPGSVSLAGRLYRGEADGIYQIGSSGRAFQARRQEINREPDIEYVPLYVIDAMGPGWVKRCFQRRWARWRADCKTSGHFSGLPESEIDWFCSLDQVDRPSDLKGAPELSVDGTDDPIAEARDYLEMLAASGMDQKALAESLGIAPWKIGGKLELLQLPAAIQAMVSQGGLTWRLGVHLAREKGPAFQWALAQLAMQGAWGDEKLGAIIRQRRRHRGEPVRSPKRKRPAEAVMA